MKNLKYNIKYIVSKIHLFFSPLKYDVMSIEDTLELVEKRKSILRFGDGEFSLISGDKILFEVPSREITNRLIDCLRSIDNEKVLLCLPETLNDLSKFEKRVQKNWVINFSDNNKLYKEYCNKQYIYGNAFLSRPYMAYKDKSNANHCFTKLMSIFKNQNIYIIEGEYSRTGVGNDLFSETKSISRIICPSQNAFEVFDEIKKAAMKIPKEDLVLLALGPTSKPLGLDLVNAGYWVIDIGHIDSEYEWFIQGVEKKVKIANKHTAEGTDTQISSCDDPQYLSSIVEKIGIGV